MTSSARKQPLSEGKCQRIRTLCKQLCSETDSEELEDLVEQLRYVVQDYLGERGLN